MDLEYVNNGVNSEGKTNRYYHMAKLTATASRYPDGSTWQSMAAYVSPCNGNFLKKLRLFNQEFVIDTCHIISRCQNLIHSFLCLPFF